MESPNVDNGVSASPILSPCSWFPDDNYCCLVHWGAFFSAEMHHLSAWVQAFLKAARLMETVLSIATTARETMSMMMLPQQPFGTNSYRLIKQAFQSVWALIFFSEEKNGLNSAFARYFQFGTGKPLLLYSKSVWKLLGAQGLMINSLAGPGFAGLQVETGFLTSCSKRQCRLLQAKKVAKTEAGHQRSIAPTEKVCVSTVLRTAELVYLQTFAMWTSICVSTSHVACHLPVATVAHLH